MIKIYTHSEHLANTTSYQWY